MDQNPFISVGLPVSLFIIMMGMGLTLTLADFVREAKAPRGVVLGSLGQLILMPLLGFAVAAILSLPPALAVGIVIIAACPGGATSNVITFLARGNVALSITLTAIASLATIVTLPLFVNYALDWQLGVDGDVRMPVTKTIMMLLVIVLIPVGIGMIINAKAHDFARKAEKAVNVFGAIVLLALIVIITYSLRERILLLIVQAGVACILLNAAGIAAGWFSSKISGLEARDWMAIGVELGIKNATIGILVAVTILKTPEMAMPSVIYGLLMYLFGFALIAYGRRALPAVTQVID